TNSSAICKSGEWRKAPCFAGYSRFAGPAALLIFVALCSEVLAQIVCRIVADCRNRKSFVALCNTLFAKQFHYPLLIHCDPVEQSMDASTKYTNTRGAAAYLTCSKSYLEKVRLTGGGPRFIKIGKAVRYRFADLDAFAEGRSHASTSE